MKTILVLFFCGIFPCLCIAQSKDELAVRNILQQQTTSWNTGNIESFMQGYWHNDSLMFIGKSGITYGWQKTLDNYKKNYPDASAMGKLDFTIIEMKKLSPQYYFVVGRWHLARIAGDLSGYFNLLFKKMGNTWFIITDHSS